MSDDVEKIKVVPAEVKVKREEEQTTEKIIESSYSQKIQEIMRKTGGGVVKIIIKRRNIKGHLEYCETIDINDPAWIDNLEEYCATRGGGGHYEAYVVTDRGQKQIASFDVGGKSFEWQRKVKYENQDKNFDDEEDDMIKVDRILDLVRQRDTRPNEEMEILKQQLNELKQQNQILLQKLEQEKEEKRKKEIELERSMFEIRLKEMQKEMELMRKAVEEKGKDTQKSELASLVEALQKNTSELYGKLIEVMSKKDDKSIQEQVNNLINKLIELKENKKDFSMDNMMGVFQQLFGMAMELAQSTQPTDVKSKFFEGIIEAFKNMVAPQNPNLPPQLPQGTNNNPDLIQSKKQRAIDEIIMTIRNSLKAKIPSEKMAEELYSAGEKLIKLGYKDDSMMKLFTNPKMAVIDFLSSLPEGKGAEMQQYIEEVAQILDEALKNAVNNEENEVNA
jgi:hypothetical protein